EVVRGMQRNRPAVRQRVAVLDLEPGAQERTADAERDDNREVRQDAGDQLDDLDGFGVHLTTCGRLAQLLDIAGERAVLSGHIAFDVGEAAVEIPESGTNVASGS